MSQQFGINSLYKIQININNPEKSSEIKANINKLLSDSAYSTAILYDQKQELEKLEKQSKQRLLILSVTVLLIILMAGIGLMNNTASSIRERILELAMLRALGSSKGQLMRILLLERVFITSLVGIISILIATLIGCMFILALGSPVTSIPINLILSLIAASPLLGLLSVFIPALWITRQNITQMLTK
ncbi:FtsX-like permease family protein [Bacillus sp. JJ864]|uniref:ABC transporter permease n=1 Tax=Bacillus sp. JJ864 TaxID=3122975 RepID=UPI003000BEB1